MIGMVLGLVLRESVMEIRTLCLFLFSLRSAMLDGKDAFFGSRSSCLEEQTRPERSMRNFCL